MATPARPDMAPPAAADANRADRPATPADMAPRPDVFVYLDAPYPLSTGAHPKDGLVFFASFNADVQIPVKNEAGGADGKTTACTSVAGKHGMAFNFLGSGRSQVRFPDSPALNPSKAITIAAWVRNTRPNPAGEPRVLQKGSSSKTDQDTQYKLMIQAPAMQPEKASIVLRLNGPGVKNISAPAPAMGEWHHVAATWDDATGDGKMYVDGVVAGMTNIHSTINPNPEEYTDLYIGSKHENDGPTVWGGDLDDVAIYNRALTAAEVTKLMND